MYAAKNITDEIRKTYQEAFGHFPEHIEYLPISGSDRKYFRIQDKDKSIIGTYSPDKNENNTFFYFTQVFQKHGLPVPEIYFKKQSKSIYFQEDRGRLSLFELLNKEGYTNRVKDLFKKGIDYLAKFHWEAARDIDYSMCFSTQSFDKEAILADLHYFKYYFVDLLKVNYNKMALLEEMEEWAKALSSEMPKTFMYRDFQSRNILVDDKDNISFIDYQGGMSGLPQYDIASLLWQAKARLPEDWKNELLNHYFSAISNLGVNPNLNETLFRKNYLECVLLRVLQTLGAYGFRGLIEKKPHFISSIYPALTQLKHYLNTWPHLPQYKELASVLQQLIKPEIIEKFVPVIQQMPSTYPLKVKLYSFSYKKGMPAAEDEHGGGFVFDCRGILNPGRIEQYQAMTGKQEQVKKYLETETQMPHFLEHVYAITDISIQDYLQRKFDSLSIAFGCTGGQHRSVYAAEKMKERLKEKYGIEADIVHLEQEKHTLKRR